MASLTLTNPTDQPRTITIQEIMDGIADYLADLAAEPKECE